MSEVDHDERVEGTDHEVPWLGQLAGIAVSDLEDGGAVLFLHGDDSSAAVEVNDPAFADGLARAGVEIEDAIEDGDSDE